MYRTIIELKEDTPNEVAKEIRQFCIKAHKNRAGQVQIRDISEKTFVFEGGEKDFACLNLPRIKNDTKSAVCKQSENPNRLSIWPR